jgi:hypothetical protein
VYAHPFEVPRHKHWPVSVMMYSAPDGDSRKISGTTNSAGGREDPKMSEQLIHDLLGEVGYLVNIEDTQPRVQFVFPLCFQAVLETVLRDIILHVCEDKKTLPVNIIATDAKEAHARIKRE